VRSGGKMTRIAVFLCTLLLFISPVFADESLSLNAVPSSGKAPLAVTFNVVSPEEVLSVSWDFEGDGVEDSTELSPSYTYAAGTYTASATVTTASGSTVVSTSVAVEDPFTVSVVAAPSSGIAPLMVKFTASVSEFPDKNTPFMFSWDFNNDGVVDSVEQNPSYTFENVGDAVVTLKVTNAVSSFHPNEVTKQIPITVSSYDSKVTIVSYFPTSLQLKENQVTFLVANEGADIIKDLSAKVIGEGIQHLSSATISRLKPSEQDSLTVNMNILKEGQVTASVKIDEKIFPVTFTVAEQVKINKAELEAKLTDLKQELQEQEDLYYQKKADGYLVEEVFDSIKDAKDQLQEAQQQILTGKLEEASINVNLAAPSVDEITRRLQTAIKQEQTLLLWLKENAVAITAIIAAVGTLSGLAVKVTKGAKKLGEDVKEKFAKKEEKGKQAPESDEQEEQKDDEKEEQEEQPTETKEPS